MMSTTTRHTERRHVRTSGAESLVDVARIAFADPRIAALLADLNPTLPATEVLLPASVVLLPAKSEALAFAKKMGFTLGYDPAGPRGTNARRQWQKLSGRTGGSSSAAKQGSSTSPHVREARAHLEMLAAWLSGTARPQGLFAWFRFSAAHCDDARAALRACRVVDALADAVMDAAPHVVAAIDAGRAIAHKDALARGVTLASTGDVGVRAAVAYAAAPSPARAHDVWSALGVHAEAHALASHFHNIARLLRQVRDNLRSVDDGTASLLLGHRDGSDRRPAVMFAASLLRTFSGRVHAMDALQRERGLAALGDADLGRARAARDFVHRSRGAEADVDVDVAAVAARIVSRYRALQAPSAPTTAALARASFVAAVTDVRRAEPAAVHALLSSWLPVQREHARAPMPTLAATALRWSFEHRAVSTLGAALVLAALADEGVSAAQTTESAARLATAALTLAADLVRDAARQAPRRAAAPRAAQPFLAA